MEILLKYPTVHVVLTFENSDLRAKNNYIHPLSLGLPEGRIPQRETLHISPCMTYSSNPLVGPSVRPGPTTSATGLANLDNI